VRLYFAGNIQIGGCDGVSEKRLGEGLRIKRGCQWVGSGSGAEGGGSYSTVGGGAGGRQEGRPTEQRVHPGRGAERTRPPDPDPHRSGVGTRGPGSSDRRSEKQNKPNFEIKI